MQKVGLGLNTSQTTVSFHWYVFPSFSMHISHPLAYNVHISPKASTTTMLYYNISQQLLWYKHYFLWAEILLIHNIIHQNTVTTKYKHAACLAHKHKTLRVLFYVLTSATPALARRASSLPWMATPVPLQRNQVITLRILCNDISTVKAPVGLPPPPFAMDMSLWSWGWKG